MTVRLSQVAVALQEDEAAALEGFLVIFRGEFVQIRRFVWGSLAPLIQSYQYPGCEDLSLEVACIQFSAEDGFVQFLKFRHREGRWQ